LFLRRTAWGSGKGNGTDRAVKKQGQKKKKRGSRVSSKGEVPPPEPQNRF